MPSPLTRLKQALEAKKEAEAGLTAIRGTEASDRRRAVSQANQRLHALYDQHGEALVKVAEAVEAGNFQTALLVVASLTTEEGEGQ